MPLILGILKETAPGETRVAATPETVKKYIAAGMTVLIEAGAGTNAAYPDQAYTDAGAAIVNSSDLYTQADVVLTVQCPAHPDLKHGATLIGFADPHRRGNFIETCAAQNVTLMAIELLPRISRAQAMDALSSQSNLAGYRAVLEAAAFFPRAFPMMMTAAGTVPPAKVFVMGAGVAGLQAIATARRLGAVVAATDVRSAVKEQVESLGAKFVMVDSDETKAAETGGGYAKEMSDDYKRAQAALVAETIAKQDIVITTALIPGRPAPKLVTAAMVQSMKPGSVIVDMAVDTGGNVDGSRADDVVMAGGVTILGCRNLATRVPTDASALYARNLLNLVMLMYDAGAGALTPNFDDEIVKGITLTRGTRIVHPAFGAQP